MAKASSSVKPASGNTKAGSTGSVDTPAKETVDGLETNMAMVEIPKIQPS
jgi:hypothetical protein